MLLTADRLDALHELGGDGSGATPPSGRSERAHVMYRALARDGLVRGTQGQGYTLTAEGREAVRLYAGMLAGGYLKPRELMASDWHFIDDDVFAALETAAHDANRVPLADASLLLARGLATLREEPNALLMYVALSSYGKAWLRLASHVRERERGNHAAGTTAGTTPAGIGRGAQPEAVSV